MTMNDALQLLIFVIFLLFFGRSFAKPVPRFCSDPGAYDILGNALSESSRFPYGVEIVSDDKGRGYRFNKDSLLLGVSTSSILHKCKTFPAEFSLVTTFKTSSVRNENQYIMALLAPDRKTLKLSLRLQRNSLHFDFYDKTKPVRQSARMTDTRLTDNSWHTVIVTVAEKEVTFFLDCASHTTSYLSNSFPDDMDIRNSRFYVGSRRRKRNRFTGILKQLQLVAGSDASISFCSSNSLYPSWLTEGPSKDKQESCGAPVKFVEDDMDDASISCDKNQKGQLVYRSKARQLDLCEGKRWKRLALGQERLDYIDDYGDLKTKSKTMDIEIFRLPSGELFLAAANQGRDRDMDSTIYKWRDGTFYPYQNISTDSAQHWEYFELDGKSYLAVANQGADERKPSASSAIYRWDRLKRKFIPHQYFRTFAAQSWKSLVIAGKHYIIVANYGGSQIMETTGSSFREKSWLYLWDSDHEAFIPYQPLDTIGAVDLEYFEMNGRHYLAVANSYDGVNSRLDSVIYRWEYSKFIPFQYIETVGAQDWEYFSIGHRHFLAVANYYDYRAKSYVINSTIYQLSEKGNRFDKIQDIETTGALDWEFFTIGKDSYLIAASSSDSNEKLNSAIYRWQGIEGFVRVHSIVVSPSADWEFFKNPDGKSFLVSANVKGKNNKLLEMVTY